jgi:hypothetical protein
MLHVSIGRLYVFLAYRLLLSRRTVLSWCVLDLRSFGLLRSVDWQSPTFRDNVSVLSPRVKQLKNPSILIGLLDR